MTWSLSTSNCRLLPPREFIKCMHTNEIHCLGRGVETYDLRLSWTTRSRNSTSTESAHFVKVEQRRGASSPQLARSSSACSVFFFALGPYGALALLTSETTIFVRDAQPVKLNSDRRRCCGLFVRGSGIAAHQVGDRSKENAHGYSAHQYTDDALQRSQHPPV